VFLQVSETLFLQGDPHLDTVSSRLQSSKTHFALFLKEAWQKAATQPNAHSGFEACGLYPYNPVQIPDEAFSICDAVLAASATDTDKVEQPQATDNISVSSIDSNGHATMSGTQSNGESHAGPSFEDIAPVPILNPLPKCRKRAAVTLTKEQISQARTHQQKRNI
jgi:hypothetical protein